MLWAPFTTPHLLQWALNPSCRDGQKLPWLCGNRQGETSIHRSCIINSKDLLWVAMEVALLNPLWVHLMCSATPYQPNSFQNTVHYMTFYTLHCTLLAIDNLQGHGLLLQTAPWQFVLEHFQPFRHHCLCHDHCHRQYHCQGLINLEVKIIWALALVWPASILALQQSTYIFHYV